MTTTIGNEGADTLEAIADASNVLVLAPAMGTDKAGLFARFTSLMGGADDLLAVSYTATPDQWLPEYRAYVDRLPERLAFVSVGESTRSASAAGAVQPVSTGPAVDGVGDPSDLTGLGIKITAYLDQFAESHAPGNAAVCFDSLSVLLQYTDVKTAFRFLHALAGRVEERGAVGYYHIDPTAHEDRELNMLRSLFDAVVEVSEDGAWSVRTRA